MFYLEIHYITKKIKESYKSITTILIDSEVEAFCNQILTNTLKNKNTRTDIPLIIGVQQQLVMDCFRYLLCTKYKNLFNLNDTVFFIDNKEVIFSEKDLWKVVTNDIWCQDLYGRFMLGIALSD